MGIKAGKKNIKKIIKKRIEISKMGVRDKLRVGGTPPLPVGLLSRGEVRRGSGGIVCSEEAIRNLNTKMFLTQYERKSIVDYDAVIIIPSYNRFDKLNNILEQLYTEETKYKIKIIICDDGSIDKRYYELKNIFSEIDYIRNTINNGKFGYWKTITSLFQQAAKYVTHAVIQIDDDFLLCDKFIDKLIDKFFESKIIDNRNVAIYYHIPTNREIGWGMSNWIDGGALFDINFLEKINFSVDEIPKKRWLNTPELSSGVWQQISIKINNNGLFTYKLDYSLAEHNGNEDSKMNTKQRIRNSITTYNFKKN